MSKISGQNNYLSKMGKVTIKIIKSSTRPTFPHFQNLSWKRDVSFLGLKIWFQGRRRALTLFRNLRFALNKMFLQNVGLGRAEPKTRKA